MITWQVDEMNGNIAKYLNFPLINFEFLGYKFAFIAFPTGVVKFKIIRIDRIYSNGLPSEEFYEELSVSTLHIGEKF